MKEEKRCAGTMVGCFDGRIQIPALSFLHELWHSDWVDVVSETAPEKILSENKDRDAISHLHQNIKASLDTQGEQRIAVVAHSTCDSNAVPDDQKKEMLRATTLILQKRYPEASVIGIWIDKNGKPQQIESC